MHAVLHTWQQPQTPARTPSARPQESCGSCTNVKRQPCAPFPGVSERRSRQQPSLSLPLPVAVVAYTTAALWMQCSWPIVVTSFWASISLPRWVTAAGHFGNTFTRDMVVQQSSVNAVSISVGTGTFASSVTSAIVDNHDGSCTMICRRASHTLPPPMRPQPAGATPLPS